MTPIGRSYKATAETLRAEIAMLTKLESRWRKTGSKRVLYRYLAAVFNLHTEWKRIGDARSVATRMARLAGSSTRRDHHPIRTVIDVTSSADRRSQSRWTQALRYAWRHRAKWPDLKQCLNANGDQVTVRYVADE